MKVTKGQKLTIRCSRKGTYNAIASKDFDTETDEFAGVTLDQDEPVRGMSKDWENGDEIPCRLAQVHVSLRIGG